MKIKWLMFIILVIVSSSFFQDEKLIKQTHSMHDPTLLARAVGQMMMVKFKGSAVDKNSFIVKKIKQYHIGGVLLDNYRYTDTKDKTANIENPKQLKILTNRLQLYAKQYNAYPLLIAVNQEGGLINALKPSHGFDNAHDPSQLTLGNANKKIIFSDTLKRALLLKKMGINLNLAPVADLNLNPNNPAVAKLQRSFGNDPKKVSLDLESAIKAYRMANILCTLKHFPGLGSASKNTDYDKADLTQTWNKKELIPYHDLIQSKITCPLIMTSHLINRNLDPSNLPASLSKKIVTDLLIKQMNYQGVIITDDMDAASIRKHFSSEEAIKKAVLAGNNIIIYGGTQGYDPEQEIEMLFNTLYYLAKSNPEIRAHVLNSYKKILQLKKFIKD